MGRQASGPYFYYGTEKSFLSGHFRISKNADKIPKNLSVSKREIKSILRAEMSFGKDAPAAYASDFSKQTVRGKGTVEKIRNRTARIRV